MAALLPALTPRLAQNLAVRLPAVIRAAARWNADRLSQSLRSLREPVSREEQARLVLQTSEAGLELMRAARAYPEALVGIMDGSEALMADAAMLAHERLGATIAGAAGEYALRMLRNVLRLFDEPDAIEQFVADPEVKKLMEGTPFEELLDMDSPGGEFIRGEIMTLVLADALEENCDDEILTRVALLAAQGFLRGQADPSVRRLPAPFLGETSDQCDQRMLHYLDVAAAASSPLEREVILTLRRVQLQATELGPMVELSTHYFRHALERLA